MKCNNMLFWCISLCFIYLPCVFLNRTEDSSNVRPLVINTQIFCWDNIEQFKMLNQSAHSVLLTWTIPDNMYNFLPNGLDHTIEYQIPVLDNATFHKVNTSELRVSAENKTYNLLLPDLPYAHMKYSIRILIKPKEAVKEEFQCNLTGLVIFTASEKPQRPPDTAIGAFDQKVYENTRDITIYWKQLNKYEEAGPNIAYKVEAYSNTEKLVECSNISYATFKNASQETINVEIWSTNDKGSSHTSSHLYIPSIIDTEIKVPLTVMSYENGTYILSWVALNVENYTIFWYHEKRSDKRINFSILKADNTTFCLHSHDDDIFRFAISANNGTNISGMIQSSCNYVGGYIRNNLIEEPKGVPGKSFVKISWTMKCKFEDNIITGYKVTYCPFKDTYNTTTDGKYLSVNTTDPKQTQINITSLKPNTHYKFKFYVSTTLGLQEQFSMNCTTSEDIPSCPRNIRINDSAFLLWDSPLDKNGITKKYVIYNFTEELSTNMIVNNDSDSERTFKLPKLDVLYDSLFYVTACNFRVDSCSQKCPTDGLVHTNRIPPSKLKTPIILNIPNLINWTEPENSSPVVDFYEVLKVRDNHQPGETLKSKNLSYYFGYCEEDVSKVEFKVRAVSFYDFVNNGSKIIRENPGEWSDPVTIDCSSLYGISITFIFIGVFAIGACVIVVRLYIRKI